MPQPAAQTGASAASAGGAGVLIPGAAAGVAAGGIAATGAGAASTPILAGAIIAGLTNFLAHLQRTQAAWMRANLSSYGTPDDIEQAIAEMQFYAREFAANSADRLAGALPQALAIADPAERERRVRQLLADEQRYAQQHSEAMAARAIAAVERHVLRRTSPQGAFWEIGHAMQHTEGCLRMQGRFWPWVVLDRVHPPRHHGCTSRLRGLADAERAGLMTRDDIPDLRTAVRMAAGVMMEGEADALLAELDVRDRLLEAGADPLELDRIAWRGIDGTAA